MAISFGLSFGLPQPWWRHQMEKFSALLAICAGNSPVTGEFPTQRPVTRSFDVYFDLRPNERLSKQSWGWWFETLSRSLWRHRNAYMIFSILNKDGLVARASGVKIELRSVVPKGPVIEGLSGIYEVHHSINLTHWYIPQCGELIKYTNSWIISQFTVH